MDVGVGARIDGDMAFLVSVVLYPAPLWAAMANISVALHLSYMT